MKIQTGILALIFIVLAGCTTNGGSGQGGSEPIGSGQLVINNQAGFDVVVFAGRIEKGLAMGKIEAGGSSSFNLGEIENLPRYGSLLIRVASMETQKRKNRLTEEDVIYTGLVVYNLNDPGDKVNINIFRGIDKQQSTFIYATNSSPYYVLELRLDHPVGDKIATLPPLSENKKIWLVPKSDGLPYRFYPTYIYVDPKTNEISSIIPKDKGGSKRAIPESAESGITPLVFAGPKNLDAVGYRVAMVHLKNDTDEGLQFMDGATILKDQKGNRFTASGRKAVFELASESGNEGQIYTNLKFDHDSGTVTSLSAHVFKPGYIYQLNAISMNGISQYHIEETGLKSKIEDARINLFLE